ncbi:hypothetical protein ABR737_25315 [Streptomyces sp. Edi2]|uniref:hypothetical protein n=1 Tax=Streptomyces sp. Edi2 TaxID=3162528 RepID=UPI0033068224
MFLPQLSADGLAVRLPIAARVEQLLDDLALAYAEDPDDLGRMLARHAASVVRLDHAVVSEDMAEYERAMRAAEADASREALVDQCPSAVGLDDLLGPEDAITLARRITRLARHIRPCTAQNRSPHP